MHYILAVCIQMTNLITFSAGVSLGKMSRCETAVGAKREVFPSRFQFQFRLHRVRVAINANRDVRGFPFQRLKQDILRLL